MKVAAKIDFKSLSDTEKTAVVKLLEDYSVRGLCEILGVSASKAHKWKQRAEALTKTEARQVVTNAALSGKISLDILSHLFGIERKKQGKGRPPALADEMKKVATALYTDPATRHLSYSQMYKRLQELIDQPLPSYYTLYRFWKSLPKTAEKRKRSRQAPALHMSNVLPGEVWMIDRYRADLFVIDPVTNQPVRPEVAVIIDKATRAILAIGAACRPNEKDTKRKYHFDRHLIGGILAQAIRGTITGIPHLPQRFVCDFGKVENSKNITDYLTYHRVIIDRTAPYTPHDKAEIEGGVIAHIHTQLEAHLPGYTGPDNKPGKQPECWNGQPRSILTAKGIVWVDNAKRVLITIDEYNEALQGFAREWNARPNTKDIRYRQPRHYRLAHTVGQKNWLETSEKYVETYLLPMEIRTIRQQGYIVLHNRIYYHPVLVALLEVYGNKAQVAVRYNPTDRSKVYLYWVDDDGCREWLWFHDTIEGNESKTHPWLRSCATLYDRYSQEHYEYDPRHKAWEAFTKRVNNAAHRAAKKSIQIPITDARRAFYYIATHLWELVEEYLANQLIGSFVPAPDHLPQAGGEIVAPPVPVAGAGNATEDAAHAQSATEGDEHALSSDGDITPEFLHHLRLRAMRKLQEEARKWRGY